MKHVSCRPPRTPGLALVLLLLLAAGVARAESLSGLWQETSTPEHGSSHVIFSQQGQDLRVACYWEFKGTPVVWHGEGTVDGERVGYALQHTRIVPGWDPRGTHELVLSPDGRTLTGVWRNSRGESGPLKFVRLR